ncbi:MAG: Mrp/NBP35 family ATP-binding protein, partial [Deltaproteobacteria bacterium]|nr:Mrp/NBP35 family ATP-binding protein [Deltaproteobacteria bacterium]
SDASWGDLDYFFIDSPPGTGDEALTVSKNIPDLKAILVTTGHSLSLLDCAKALSYLRTQGVDIFGVVDNMGDIVCPNCGFDLEIFSPENVKSFALKENVPLLSRIPQDLDAQKRSERLSKPIFDINENGAFTKKIKDLAGIL